MFVCLYVLIFILFYCLLDPSCGECDVISLDVLCCSVNVFLCVARLTGFVN